MARTSRYENKKTNLLNIGLYVRLSDEDGKDKESESIKNQKILLECFVKDLDNVGSYKFYVDDGYSGGNFNRPAFETMMNDIVDKKINCVIVKDFSRFGRNYKVVGDYLQILFPTMKVRFISIVDKYDSSNGFVDLDTLSVALGDLMNEQYLSDCSAKAKLSYQTRRNNGQFTSPVAPYGYERDEQDKHKLIIDECVAPIVKYIYKDFLLKKTITAVTRDLCEAKIMSPSEYKQTKKSDYYTNRKTNLNCIWSRDSVKTILTSEFYIGNLVQHRREVVDYKTKKVVKLPKEQWVKIENTHEPIIDIETYKQVQNLLSSQKTRCFKTGNKKQPDNYFSGICRCGKCGTLYTYVNDKNRKYTFYKCKLHSISKNLCDNEYIKTDTLKNIVLPIIQKYVKIACDIEDVIKQINVFKAKKNNKDGCYNSEQYLAKKQRMEKYKDLLYEQYRDGIINVSQYINKKEKIENDIAEIDIKLKQDIVDFRDSVENKFISTFTSVKKIKQLSQELVKQLIDKIIIYDNHNVEIEFKFQDEYKNALEYIEKNREILSNKTNHIA